ncbi:MAG: MoxR family ATPase [Opitutales bacterium]|nr:MoxR family ATPase [Opitutales bacterium]MCH8540621.1 MoxR family ATPase [Opitutales bacterium]
MTTPTTPPDLPAKPPSDWSKWQEKSDALRRELGKVIVGQEEVIESMLVALLCRGHCLIEGVPGLAKTLLVNTLGKVLGLSAHRIQFTPDLMPSDILGSEVLRETPQGGREFQFLRGPVFANLILADEINRTPPKTQSALLEAMQERQVSVAGNTIALPRPFVVFATQNPIEHEGTYPLPEAQLDRFFFHLVVGYPSREQEKEVVLRTSGGHRAEVSAVTNAEEVLEWQTLLGHVPLPDHVLETILDLVHRSRPKGPQADEFVQKYVAWGAGPRASQFLAEAVRALALVRGETAASVEEVKALARPVLRHRVVPNYNATGDGVTVDQIIDHLLKGISS